MIQLPEKLSDLLEIAVEDVRAMENTPGYVVHMEKWHTPLTGGPCLVCAAGSVMARRLDVSDSEDFFSCSRFTERFGLHNANALLAIDELRKGCVGEALACAELGAEHWFDHDCDAYTHDLDREVAEYNEDRAQWHLDMAELVEDLRRAGM